MEILKNRQQIVEARKILKKRGLSFIRNQFISYLIHRFKIRINNIGDFNKSWDVLSTLNFIEKNADKKSKVLDVGCCNSEIILSLRSAGYENLYGIDIDPMVKNMPFSKKINYKVGNYFNNNYSEESFDIITSISSIEHGYDEKKFFSEYSRLLKKNGKLIITFDFWNTKIDTGDIKMFGLTWNIFSENEVNTMIDNVEKKYNLALIGKKNFLSENRVIKSAGKNYTFAWLCFNKI